LRAENFRVGGEPARKAGVAIEVVEVPSERRDQLVDRHQRAAAEREAFDDFGIIEPH
jgi:hypothetical protein